jgi:putative SOS response-associated peptidase YedK
LFEVHPVETEPRYNVAPTENIVTIRRTSLGREATRLRWGLIPEGTKDPGDLPLIINARRETIATRPAFRVPFRERRCLVVADGFYEWLADAGGKRPFWVHLVSGRPFALAGIWDRWEGPDGPVESCAIVTTEASEDLAPIHDRMPAVLEPERARRWLAAGAGPSELNALLADQPPGRLARREVSTRVSSIENDDPECLSPSGTQVDLFA